MDKLSKKVLQTLKQRPYRDYSHIKLPTKHAVDFMIANLHKAEKEKQ